MLESTREQLTTSKFRALLGFQNLDTGAESVLEVSDGPWKRKERFGVLVVMLVIYYDRVRATPNTIRCS